MTDEQQRTDALAAYLNTDDPAERQRLALAWLDAGGREMMEQAFRDGLRPLKCAGR